MINNFYEKIYSSVLDEFLRDHFGGFVTIDLNYAIMTIEMLMPPAADRGKYKVLVSHKVEHYDKITIDYCDGFPRYYFSFDCMISEVRDWIDARKILKINEIFLYHNDNSWTFSSYFQM